MAPGVGVALHVGHLASKVVGEPVAQAVEAVRRRRGGDASQLEAKGVRLLLDTVFLRHAVHLTAHRATDAGWVIDIQGHEDYHFSNLCSLPESRGLGR